MSLALVPQSKFLTRKEVSEIVGVNPNTPNGIVVITRTNAAPLVCLVASATDKRYSDSVTIQKPDRAEYSFREQEVKRDGTAYKHPKPFQEYGPCFENKKIYNLLEIYPELETVLLVKHKSNVWSLCPDPFLLRNGVWNPLTKKGHFILYKPSPQATPRGLLSYRRTLQIIEEEEN
jgi:hypothetical protein